LTSSTGCHFKILKFWSEFFYNGINPKETVKWCSSRKILLYKSKYKLRTVFIWKSWTNWQL
jgi:hypothetical protein